MNFFRASELTPGQLEKIIHKLEWADHYEISRVEFKKTKEATEIYIFQAYEGFVREYLLPITKKIEIGVEKRTKLLYPANESQKVLVEHEINDFEVVDFINPEAAKKAATIIAWYFLNTNSGPMPFYPMASGKPENGISIRLFNKKDTLLLNELLQNDFTVVYRDFDWAPFK